MRRYGTCVFRTAGVALAVLVGGCTAISIEPSCPNELRVGESKPVSANEVDPGAIPTYLWEVFPVDAGTFADPFAPNTMFQASAEGEAVIRLTASDGLYQVISVCRTRVRGVASVAVTLTASPSPAEVDETVTLTCSSAGSVDATTYEIVQVDGENVALSDLDAGVTTFTADQPGSRTFECVGESEDGAASEPISVTVSVTPRADGNDNAADNINGNANVNDNDNAANDNVNDNGQDNTNDNVGDNGNDNEGRIPPRP